MLPSLRALAAAATAIIVSFGWASPATAEDASSKRAAKREAMQERYHIDAIVVDGLFLTKPNVVTRELEFGEGEVVTRRQIEQSVQRLRNLGIFRIAEYELLDRRIPLPDGTLPEAEQDRRILLITVDERWTLIPFGTFASSGGTLSLTTGLYDINFLGRYIQLGGQFQHFAGTNSFAFWWADPRFIGRRVSVGASIAQTNRINVFYGRDRRIEGAHLLRRRSVAASMSYEWHRWLSTGVGLSFADDVFSVDLLSDELAQRELRRGLPERTDALSASASLRFGKIDANSFLRKGAAVGIGIRGAAKGFGASYGYVDNTMSFTSYLMLPLRSNFAFRAAAGTTTVKRPEYEFFVGGLGVLRGFLHRRFRGTRYWYSNAELRVPSIDTRWLVLQHIGFLDTAAVGDTVGELGTIDGMSTGVGLRILSPKIFSLVGRIDYAFPLIGDGGAALSFGAGQFF